MKTTILAISALVGIPTILLGAIVWKLTQYSLTNDAEAATLLGDTHQDENDSVEDDADDVDRSQAQVATAQGNARQVSDAERERVRDLIRRCELKQYGACDELVPICESVLQGAGMNAPGAMPWRLMSGSIRHTVESLREGCGAHFRRFACELGSDDHCLRLGTLKALGVGCKRGCSECCEKKPPSDAELSRREDLLRCEARDPDACLRLAFQGERAPPEEALQARQFATKACELEQRSCDELAAFLGLGIGGAKDEKGAYDLMMMVSKLPPPPVGCAPANSVRCRKLNRLSFWDNLSTYALETTALNCTNGDLRACMATSFPSQRNTKKTLAMMETAISQLYPDCPSLLSPCPQAQKGCIDKDLRACLTVVARAGRGSHGSFELAMQNLDTMCRDGAEDACIQ